MKGLLFACRVAFLLNILYVISFLAYKKIIVIDNQFLVGFLVTAGLILAVIVNAVLNTILAVRVLRGKSNAEMPAWLINTNFIILIFQIIFFFFT